MSGLKVVEVSGLVAGPAMGSLLFQLGAEVFKIEQPMKGDPSRQVSPWGFLNYNYGKKSVTLNLKIEEGRKVLYRLVEQADIFVENLGPDVPEKLGFSFDQLQKINPSIIYCSIKGFAKGSEAYKKPSFDAVAQALSGMMSLTGEPGREPVRIGNPSVDLGAAAYGVIQVLGGIMERTKSGKGIFIEVSLLDLSVYWNGYWLTYFGITGNIPQRLGSGHPGYCPHKVFKTSEGAFVFIAALSDMQWKSIRFGLKLPLGSKFDHSSVRLQEREKVEQVVSNAIKEMTTAEVLSRLSDLVPCAPVLTISEVYGDAQFDERNVLRKVRYNKKGVKIVLPPLRNDGDIPRSKSDSILETPRLGNDTVRVLRALGYSETDIRRLRSIKAI